MSNAIEEGFAALRRLGVEDVDGSSAFEEPWQAQAFATVVALHRRGLFRWEEWVEILSAAIRDLPQTAGERANAAYYRQWLAALEGLLAKLGLVQTQEVERAQEDWRLSYLRTVHGQPVVLQRGLSRH